MNRAAPAQSLVSNLTFEDIIDQIIALLARADVLPQPIRPTPWDAFIRLSDLIHENFVVPSTTFTPIMRRLLFALGFAARAQHVVAVGSYVAYTYAWLMRDRGDAESGPHLASAVGIDTDAEANVIARHNCSRLGHGERIRFLDADGCSDVDRTGSPIDLLYLDLDSPDTGKAGYLAVLNKALPCLNSGAIILAHDACLTKFADDMADYHRAIEESGVLAGPWLLPVDFCGLSIAMRLRSDVDY